MVNKGLDRANNSYDLKNSNIMDSFLVLYNMDKKRVEPYFDNAKKARTTADLYFNYIQSIKDRIAARSGGYLDNDKSTVVDDKNLEVSTIYFMQENHGEKLKDSLNQFVKTMKSYLNGHTEALKFKIDTDDPPRDRDGTRHTWVEYYWEGVPSIAAITELTKFQNDIRNVESEVTNWNYKHVGTK